MEITALSGSVFDGIQQSGHIFDYAYGQALRDDILAGGNTTGAGIFLADHKSIPRNLGEVHDQVMRSAIPLSWFVLQHIPHQGGLNPDDWDDMPLLRDAESDVASMIASGSCDVISIIAKHIGDDEVWKGKWLPHATLTVTIAAGSQQTSDRPRWQQASKNRD